jgi:hypothetical protein
MAALPPPAPVLGTGASWPSSGRNTISNFMECYTNSSPDKLFMRVFVSLYQEALNLNKFESWLWISQRVFLGICHAGNTGTYQPSSSRHNLCHPLCCQICHLLGTASYTMGKLPIWVNQLVSCWQPKSHYCQLLIDAFNYQNGGNLFRVGKSQRMAAMYGTYPALELLGEFTNFDAGTQLVQSWKMVLITHCYMRPFIGGTRCGKWSEMTSSCITMPWHAPPCWLSSFSLALKMLQGRVPALGETYGNRAWYCISRKINILNTKN